VRILVTEVEAQTATRRSIQEVRQLLKGGVERFDDPTQPMIPEDHWEMLK